MRRAALLSIACFVAGLLCLGQQPNAYWHSVRQVAISGGAPTFNACGSGGWTGPTSGLTHCWPMDDAHVTSTVNDNVGSINGSITGTVTSGTGPTTVAGTARTFDGSTGYLPISSNPVTSWASAFTVAFWANLTTPSTVGSGGFSPRFLNWNDGTLVLVMYDDHSLSGQGSFSVAAVSGGSSTAFSSGTWGHLALTFDGTSTYKVYFNGSLNNSGTTAGVGNSATTVIGARDTSGNGLWPGSMSQVVVYNVELSAGNITTLYNAK